MPQCQCITKNYKKCKTKASTKSGYDPRYCWRHQNCNTNINFVTDIKKSIISDDNQPNILIPSHSFIDDINHTDSYIEDSKKDSTIKKNLHNYQIKNENSDIKLKQHDFLHIQDCSFFPKILKKMDIIDCKKYKDGGGVIILINTLLKIKIQQKINFQKKPNNILIKIYAKVYPNLH